MLGNIVKRCLSCWVQDSEDLAAIAALVPQVEMVEIRADPWKQPDWRRVRETIPVEIIATVRQTEYWKNHPAHWFEQYIAAVRAGIEWIDIDMEMLSWLDSAFITEVLAQQGVLSAHLRDGESWQKVVQKMLKIPARVYKCVLPVSYARSIHDVVAVIKAFRSAGRAFVVHAAGEDSTSVRLWATLLGNQWIYVSCGQQPTAAGQPSLSMLERYGLEYRTSQSRVLGIFGYPLVQSRSWELHNTLLRIKGCAQRWIYLNFADPDFRLAFAAWAPWLDGASVTIPHKQTAVSFCQYLSPEVARTRVCNTIVRQREEQRTALRSEWVEKLCDMTRSALPSNWIRDSRESSGSWIAYNTDFWALEELLIPFRSRIARALVVGTGATARTAIGVLQKLGVKDIWVMGRNKERIWTVAQQFACHPVKLGDRLPVAVDVVVHTTPVGMAPQTEAMLPLQPYLHPEVVLLDVVYSPSNTRLIRTARQMGVATIIDGSQMFVRQARYQFELFTGIPVTEDEIDTVWQTINEQSRSN